MLESNKYEIFMHYNIHKKHAIFLRFFKFLLTRTVSAVSAISGFVVESLESRKF